MTIVHESYPVKTTSSGQDVGLAQGTQVKARRLGSTTTPRGAEAFYEGRLLPRLSRSCVLHPPMTGVGSG